MLQNTNSWYILRGLKPSVLFWLSVSESEEIGTISSTSIGAMSSTSMGAISSISVKSMISEIQMHSRCKVSTDLIVNMSCNLWSIFIFSHFSDAFIQSTWYMYLITRGNAPLSLWAEMWWSTFIWAAVCNIILSHVLLLKILHFPLLQIVSLLKHLVYRQPHTKTNQTFRCLLVTTCCQASMF